VVGLRSRGVFNSNQGRWLAHADDNDLRDSRVVLGLMWVRRGSIGAKLGHLLSIMQVCHRRPHHSPVGVYFVLARMPMKLRRTMAAPLGVVSLPNALLLYESLP
jgi:hypothetical protein